MRRLYHNFYMSIRWNALEAVLYQGLLCIHQLALFWFVSPHFYGLVGTIFSIIYLASTISNMGLDATLPLFFPHYSSSKRLFRKSFLFQIIPELCIIGIVAVVTLLWALFFPFKSLSTPLIACILFLFISEALRKSMRTLLQLLFLAHVVAPIEIASLVIYVVSVWSMIFAGVSLQLHHVFIPLLATSAVACFIKAIFLYFWYSSLPDSLEAACPSWRCIARQRFFNMITHVSHIFFSSNFLVPFCALHYGTSSAGLFKIISSLIHFVSLSLKKICGTPSAAFLANSKNASFEEKKRMYTFITQTITRGFLISFIVIVPLLFVSMQRYPTLTHDVNYSMLVIYITIIFSEYFFMTYELIFIAQEQAALLCCLSLASLGFLSGTLYVTHHIIQSPLLMILLGCAIRALSFGAMQLYGKRLWHRNGSLTGI